MISTMEQLEQGKNHSNGSLSQLKTPRERPTNTVLPQNGLSHRSRTLISNTHVSPDKSAEQKGQFVISYNFDHNSNMGAITRNIFIGWDDEPYKKPIKKLNTVKNTAPSKTAPKNKLPLLNTIIDQTDQKQNTQAALTKRKGSMSNSNNKNKITNKECDPTLQNHPYIKSKQCSFYNSHNNSNKINDQTTLKHEHMPAIGIRGKQNMELIQNRNTITHNNNNCKFRNSSVNSLRPIQNPIQKTARILQNQNKNQKSENNDKIGVVRQQSRYKQSSFSYNSNKSQQKQCLQVQPYRNGRTIEHKQIPKISNRNQILQSSFSKPKMIPTNFNINTNTNINKDTNVIIKKQNNNSLNKLKAVNQQKLEKIDNGSKNNKKIFNKTVDQKLFLKQQQQSKQEDLQIQKNNFTGTQQLLTIKLQKTQQNDKLNQQKQKSKIFHNDDDDNFCNYGANTLKLIQDLQKMQSNQTPIQPLNKNIDINNNNKESKDNNNVQITKEQIVKQDQNSVELSLQKKCQAKQQSKQKLITQNKEKAHHNTDTVNPVVKNEKKQNNNMNKNNKKQVILKDIKKEQNLKEQRKSFHKKQQNIDQNNTMKKVNTSKINNKSQQKIKQKSKQNISSHKESAKKDHIIQKIQNQPKGKAPIINKQQQVVQNSKSKIQTTLNKKVQKDQKIQVQNIVNLSEDNKVNGQGKCINSFKQEKSVQNIQVNNKSQSNKLKIENNKNLQQTHIENKQNSNIDQKNFNQNTNQPLIDENNKDAVQSVKTQHKQKEDLHTKQDKLKLNQQISNKKDQTTKKPYHITSEKQQEIVNKGEKQISKLKQDELKQNIQKEVKNQNQTKIDSKTLSQQKFKQKTVTEMKLNQQKLNFQHQQKQQKQKHSQQKNQNSQKNDTQTNIKKQQEKNCSNNRLNQQKQNNAHKLSEKQSDLNVPQQSKIALPDNECSEKPVIKQFSLQKDSSIKALNNSSIDSRRSILTKPQIFANKQCIQEVPSRTTQVNTNKQQYKNEPLSNKFQNSAQINQDKEQPAQKLNESLIQPNIKPNSGAAIHRKRQSNKLNINVNDSKHQDQNCEKAQQIKHNSVSKFSSAKINQTPQKTEEKSNRQTIQQAANQSEANVIKGISQQSKRSQHSLGQSLKRNNMKKAEDAKRKPQIMQDRSSKKQASFNKVNNTKQQQTAKKVQQSAIQNPPKLKQNTNPKIPSSQQKSRPQVTLPSNKNPLYQPQKSFSNIADSDSQLQTTPPAPITNPSAPRQLTCISKNSSKLSLTGRIPPHSQSPSSNLTQTGRLSSNHTVTSRSQKISQHRPIKIKEYRHASVQMTEKSITNIQKIGNKDKREDVGVGSDQNYCYQGINVSVGTSVKEVKQTGIQNKMDQQLIQYRQQQEEHKEENIQPNIAENVNKNEHSDLLNLKTNSLINNFEQHEQPEHQKQKKFNNQKPIEIDDQLKQQEDNIVSFANISCQPKISPTKKQSFLDISNVDNLNHTDFPTMLKPIKQRKFNSSQCTIQHAAIVSYIYGDQQSQIQSSLPPISPLCQPSPYISFPSLQPQNNPVNIPLLSSQSPSSQSSSSSLSPIMRAIHLVHSMNPKWLTRILQPYLSLQGEHQLWLHVKGQWHLYRSNYFGVNTATTNGGFDVMLAGVIQKIYQEQYCNNRNSKGKKQQNMDMEIQIQDVIAMITGFRVMQLKNKKKLSQQIQYHLKKGNIIKGISSDPTKQSYSITAIETTAKQQKLIQIQLSQSFSQQNNDNRKSDRILWIKQQTFQKYFDYFLLVCQQKESYWTTKDIKTTNVNKNVNSKDDEGNWGQTLVYTLDSIEKAVGVIQVHVQHPCICKMDLYRQIKPKILKFLGTVNQPSKCHTSLSNSNLSFNFNLSGRYYLLIKFNELPSSYSSQQNSSYPYFSLCSSQKITVSYLQSIQPETYKNSTSQYIQISNSNNNNSNSNSNSKHNILKSKNNSNHSLNNKNKKQIKKMFVDYLMGKDQLAEGLEANDRGKNNEKQPNE